MKKSFTPKWLTLLVTWVTCAMILQPAPGWGAFSLKLEEKIQSSRNADEAVYAFSVIPDEGTKGDGWLYKWHVEGPGRISSTEDGSQGQFVYSKQEAKENPNVTLTLDALSTSLEEIESAQFSFAIDQLEVSSIVADDSTSTYIIIGAAILGAAAIGIGVAYASGFDDCDDGCRNYGRESSVNITYPEEDGLVGWTSSVSGTASNYDSEDQVVIFIQPYGYGWYQQSSRGRITNGRWIADPCYFGRPNSSSDIGRSFRIRAELRDRNGDIRAIDTVSRVIRTR